MITVIINSYNEPNAALRAVKTILDQKVDDKVEVILTDPFEEVGEFLKNNINDKRFEFFLDPGEGKSYSLNMLLQERNSENQDDFFVFTDGDVFVSDNTLQEIVEAFKNPKVGCVTGRPVSVNSRKTKMGYWSKLLYDGIDRVRKNKSSKDQFFQGSGYLFAIRKGVIFDFPLNVPEDCIIPYLVWKKGFLVKYLSRAEVYVKYPTNWKDWLNQRVRTIKGHENIPIVAPDMPRTKSFLNEIKEGTLFALKYPKNVREVLWTAQLFLARAYIWGLSFFEIRRNKKYQDGWRETEINSTKPLD